MKDMLVKSTYKEFTHIRTPYGQVYMRDVKGYPRVEAYERQKDNPNHLVGFPTNTFIKVYDKGGDLHYDIMACTAHLLGIEFLTKRLCISERFESEIVPFKTHTVDNHGHEYDAVDQWCIPIPKGVISNPDGMKVNVEVTEVRQGR